MNLNSSKKEKSRDFTLNPNNETLKETNEELKSENINKNYFCLDLIELDENPNNINYSININNNLCELDYIDSDSEIIIKKDFIFLELETKYFKLTKKDENSSIKNIQDFECLACFHIVNDPIVCAECEKLICKECLGKWWQEKSSRDKLCIHCKKTFYELFMPRIVRNTMNCINIKCPNKNSCGEIFEYQNLKKHLESCKYTKRKALCNYCCTEFETSNEGKEISLHVLNCPLALVKCEFCNQEIHKNKINNHKKFCNQKFTKCPDCLVSLDVNEYIKHSKEECILNLKNFYEGKYNQYVSDNVSYKEKYEKLKTLQRIVPYYIKLIVNKNKIDY